MPHPTLSKGGARAPVINIKICEIIEGVQNFEKIRILREEFKRMADKTRLNKLNTALSAFEIRHLNKTPASDMVEKAKTILNEL